MVKNVNLKPNYNLSKNLKNRNFTFLSFKLYFFYLVKLPFEYSNRSFVVDHFPHFSSLLTKYNNFGVLFTGLPFVINLEKVTFCTIIQIVLLYKFKEEIKIVYFLRDIFSSSFNLKTTKRHFKTSRTKFYACKFFLDQ